MIHLFFFLAGLCNAAMDVVSFHYDRSIFERWDKHYFNPLFSYRNKYVDGDSRKGRKKFFFKLLPIPVWITDFWHLMKSGMLTAIMIGTLSIPVDPFIPESLIHQILYLFSARLFYGVGFWLGYRKFFMRG